MEEHISPVSSTACIEPLSPKEDRPDILTLVRHYIRVAEEQINTEHKELSKETEEYLLTHDWNGKEKELEMLVKKVCILSEESKILFMAGPDGDVDVLKMTPTLCVS